MEKFRQETVRVFKKDVEDLTPLYGEGYDFLLLPQMQAKAIARYITLNEYALGETRIKLIAKQKRIDSLFGAIAHGDRKHQQWLRKAIKDHFLGFKVQREKPRNIQKKSS